MSFHQKNGKKKLKILMLEFSWNVIDSNADLLIFSTDDGILICSISLSLETSANVIDFRLIHFSKAHSPILSTDEGIEIDSRVDEVKKKFRFF